MTLPALTRLRQPTFMELAARRCEQYRVDGYQNLADAVWHFADEVQRALTDLDAQQDTSDSDDALAPPSQALSPEQILRRGILSLEEEASEAVERLVTEQEGTYRAILREQGPEPLIEALLARDRQLARTGRELASGRAATKMLREFVRGLLHLADYATVRRVGDATKTGQIEQVLEALGAEPADLRQLKLHGTTLGETEGEEGE